MGALREYRLRGNPGEQGHAHGVMLGEILDRGFVERYIGALGEVIGFEREDLGVQAARWLRGLPRQFQEEIEGMGRGSGLGTLGVAEFLYADIARPTTASVVGEPGVESRIVEGGGPMCSALIARLECGSRWIGRNCDWLVPTLMRGTAVVVHETPNRIPVMAVGIRGDIDVDTGMNAEGLWLHLHTLYASDDPSRDKTCISWLFWAREALEVCSTLEELERFVESTGRDRGVLAIAGEQRTGEVSIFECTRSGHMRHDIDAGAVACATNHSPGRPETERPGAVYRSGGSLGRQRSMRRIVGERGVRRGPEDVMGVLGSEGVEMRDARWLRTIYSAVVRLEDGAMWFAAGGADGVPAASGGEWGLVNVVW